jgi:hypothetical protein
LLEAGELSVVIAGDVASLGEAAVTTLVKPTASMMATHNSAINLRFMLFSPPFRFGG